MIRKILNYPSNLAIKDFGQLSFYLSAFFLASALPISVLFLLISIIIYFKDRKLEFLNDKKSYLLIICSLLIILSSLNSTQNLKDITLQSDLNVWIGIFNWIPLFAVFIISKFYLIEHIQRETFMKFLIAGSIPLIFSCILESWFKLDLDLQTFNGLITWFSNSEGGVSGLFSNQNYTGVWLNVILAFLLFEIKNNQKRFLSKSFLMIFVFLTIYFLILTASRNSFIGMLITIIITINPRKLLILIPIFGSIIIVFKELILNIFFGGTDPNNQFLFKKFSILKLINSISNGDLENLLDAQRFEIYAKTLNLIPKNPFLGWGSNTFQNLYKSSGGLSSAQHTHSMPLELAYNYGLPLTFLILALVIQILFESIKKTFFKRSNQLKVTMDKHWIIAFSVIALSYLNDVTYYDGKISILTWILLAGISSINENQDIEKNIPLK